MGQKLQIITNNVCWKWHYLTIIWQLFVIIGNYVDDYFDDYLDDYLDPMII